jgi:hypothetical protein
MLHRRDSHPPPAQQSDRLAGAIATAMEEQQATVNSTPFTRNGQSTATAAEKITATVIDVSELAEHSRVDVGGSRKLACDRRAGGRDEEKLASAIL